MYGLETTRSRRIWAGLAINFGLLNFGWAQSKRSRIPLYSQSPLNKKKIPYSYKIILFFIILIFW